jgi:cyclophilin family peptidyl-prolyl cis-trans isomerase
VDTDSPQPAQSCVSKAPDDKPAQAQETWATDATGLSLESAIIKTDAGKIRIRFYPRDAPCTVARIRELIQSKFYDGLRFHRVIPGFLVQGGDPLATGTGGSGKTLKAEFNQRHHVEGTVAMARKSDPDSADSQFYISLGTYPHLDGQYTVFGQVVEGMDVVKKIEIGDYIRAMTLDRQTDAARQGR